MTDPKVSEHSLVKAAAPDAERATAAPHERAIEALIASDKGAFQPRPRDELTTRSVNILVASTALLVLAPFLIPLGLLVAATSRGPIIYRQTRVGLDRRRRSQPLDIGRDRRVRDLGGEAFHIYKFRSMVDDAEHDGAVWATANDARVTSLGRVLRALRLDEAPQLINVLRGDMNIVGPRPERPGIFLHLRDVIEDYPLRQLGRPGITGWAQINHHYDQTIDDVRTKVRYDLEYLRHQGLTEDLRIMLKTIPVMLLRRGSL